MKHNFSTMKFSTMKYYLLVIVVAILSSCHKNSGSKDCGCQSDSFRIVTNIDGFLSYMVIDNQKRWYVSAPQSSKVAMTFLAKICNEQLPALKGITDTLSTESTAVLFSGKLKPVYPDDARWFPGPYLANSTQNLITLDSVKNNGL